jgi:putative transcriptional regulator
MGRQIATIALLLALLAPAYAQEFTEVLVATPSLQDGQFDRSVVLVIRHGKMRDLLGIILNRPLDRTLGEVAELDDDHPFSDIAVYHGGPVAQRVLVGLVACEGKLNDALPVSDGLYVTLNLSEIEARWDEIKVTNIRIFRGYAGWAPGQLEHEIRREAWKYEPVHRDQLFMEDTRDIWQRLNSQTVAYRAGHKLQY